MRNTILSVGLLLLMLPAAAFSQAGAPPANMPPPLPMPSPSGTAPQIAFDIPKSDIDTLLKNARLPPSIRRCASWTWRQVQPGSRHHPSRQDH